MANFTLLKGNCPICAGIRNGKRKADCKQSGELIHCFSHNDPPPGFRFVGQSAIGQSLYAPEREKGLDPEQHRAELAKLRAEHQAQAAAQREQLPTIPERHQEILGYPAELTPTQNADLLRRGLDQAEIDFALCHHWLFACQGGYGITAIDAVSGMFCGAQRALDDRSQRKYDWAIFTGRNQLKETGENPLFLWKSPDFDPSQPYEINFCEGALKSLIRAFLEWRHSPQVILVGAAGGIFGEQSVKRLLSAHGQVWRFTLLPDADSQNLRKKNLYAGYGQLAKAIPAIKFADWGQWQDKSQGDCDEGLQDYVRRSPNVWLQPFKLAEAAEKTLQVNQRFAISPTITINDEAQYLPDDVIPLPTAARIVGLEVPKNCGKSYQQGLHIEKLRSLGYYPIQMSHRRGLAAEKAKEWQMTYIEADSPLPPEMPSNGLSVVVDSVLKLRHYDFSGQKVVLFWDEIEQILEHICHSTTAIRERRASVMAYIGELMGIAHQVVLADADLKTIAVDWAISLTKSRQSEICLIRKQYRHNRKAIICQDTTDALVYAAQQLQENNPTYIAVAGQKANSRFGSQSLEQYLSGQSLSTIRIDSDTNRDPSHPAYKITKNIEVLNHYQLAIATAVIGTGVNIKGDHFKSVVGIAAGHESVESFLQKLGRVRNDGDRLVAISSTANSLSQRYGGHTKVQELLLDDFKHGQLLRKHLKSFGDWGDNWLFNPWLKAFAERICLNNELGKDYKASVIAQLHKEGYQVIEQSFCDKGQRKKIRKLLDGGCHQQVQQYIADILASKPKLGEALKVSKGTFDQTYPDKCAEVHGDLLTLYGDDSEAIAQAHLTQRNFYRKLQLHFWLQQQQKAVKQRDERKLQFLCRSNEGKLFQSDVTQVALSVTVKAMRKLGLADILQRGYIASNCPHIERIKQILNDDDQRQDFSRQLRLGLDDCPRKSPVAILGFFLKNLLGLDVTRDAEGKAIRSKREGVLITPIDFGDIDRESIFQFWEENSILDDLEEEKITTKADHFLKTNIFSIEKNDPVPETSIQQGLQRADHFFPSSRSSSPDPEDERQNPAVLAVNGQSPPAQIPDYPVSPIPWDILRPIQDAIMALVKGDRRPLWRLVVKFHFPMIQQAAQQLDVMSRGSGFMAGLYCPLILT
ncbi:hypothetical protein NIES970_29110 (plasmid) [[Synechococcus] sp. NIES-970]|nr:hypothetical protein NIES970_29110 [[Synechococcus] sp. NIES-970]